MTGLFMPSKSNKRPLPETSRGRPDQRSPPPPPPSITASTSYLGHLNGNEYGGPGGGPSALVSANPRLRTSLPSLGNSASASGPSHGPSQRSTSHTAPPLPFPDDASLKAKVDYILRQVVRLVQIESQTLDSSSTANVGAFEANDLASEEAEELKRLWIEENLGGLLMMLVERVGTDVVNRKVEVLKRDVERLKSTSSRMIPSGADYPTPPPHFPPSTSTPSSLHNDEALSDALSRIRTLEEQLKRSDQEREELRTELRDKDKNLEQRLQALENRTVDPRRRALLTGGNSGSSTPAASSNPSTAFDPTACETELSKAKQEVEQLKARVSGLEGEFVRRKRDAEDEGELERGAFEKVRKQMGDHSLQLEATRAEIEVLQVKIRDNFAAFDLPLPSAPNHPTNLQASVEALSKRVADVPGITELESSLLRGLFEFMSTVSTAPVGSLSPSATTETLRNSLAEIHESIRLLASNTAKLERSEGARTEQLESLLRQLAGARPILDWAAK
ncbi:hypothetical protein JCM11491_000954 [Sporobolomyces phaffii]